MGTKQVEVDCELITETDAAWLVDAGSGEVWIPKSLADYDDDEEVLTLPEWLAIKEGLV